MKKLKIGILGTSNHFLKRIVLPLQQTNNCEAFAIGSRNIEKAEAMAQEFNIPMWYGSYQAVLDDPDVDMIYIPLPNHMHKEWVEKSIDAGKPVLCEKPLGMTAAEANQMVAKAQEAGIPLMEGFMYMFHPMWQHARNIIKTGQIGDVQYIHTAFSYNNPSPTNIRNIPEYGGGALMDIGCYAISVPRFIMGKEPAQVMALQSTHPSITIHIPFNTYVDVAAKMTVTDGMGTRDIEFPPANAYGLMFDAFADAVINNKPLPVSHLDAINNMKVIDAVQKSGETNEWVKI
jgi:predicted dehydrogenase